MNQQLKKSLLFIFLFGAYGFLNYNPQMLFGLNSPHWGWILSLLATSLIFIIMKGLDKKNWRKKLGINFDCNDIWKFLSLTILLLVLSYYVVDYISSIEGYAFKPKIFYYKTYPGEDYPFRYVFANYLYYLPETLNEEMLIGALLLFELERKFIKLNKSIIAIAVAIVFSLMHQGLYRWSPVQTGELLTFTTILTLFFVGVLRNALILKTRKITFSWAIHLSFNIIFFSGFFIDKQSQLVISEPEKFNLVFGNLSMLLLTALLAFLSVIWLNLSGFKKVLETT